MQHTEEIISAVCNTPRSQSQWCAAYHLRGVHHIYHEKNDLKKKFGFAKFAKLKPNSKILYRVYQGPSWVRIMNKNKHKYHSDTKVSSSWTEFPKTISNQLKFSIFLFSFLLPSLPSWLLLFLLCLLMITYNSVISPVFLLVYPPLLLSRSPTPLMSGFPGYLSP